MDEGTKTIALGPRSRKAKTGETGDEDQNCVVAVVAKKTKDAPTGRETDKLICSTQNRLRKAKILITRDDEDPDLR